MHSEAAATAATPKPKPVMASEVVPFSKPACKNCFGKGIVGIYVGKERQERVCRCALKGFMARHQPDVMSNANGLYWKPGAQQ